LISKPGIDLLRLKNYINFVLIERNGLKKDDISRTQALALFIEKMKQENGLAEWQTVQIADAVSFFYNAFIPEFLRHNKSIPGFEIKKIIFYTKVSFNKWENVISELKSFLKIRHLALRTGRSYLDWLMRFKYYVSPKKPDQLKSSDVVSFLDNLAVEKRISASTQNQALSALVFFFKYVLEQPIVNISSAVRAKRSQTVPVFFSHQEIKTIFNLTKGTYGLILKLIYGSGLRLREALCLRIKDIDFDLAQISINDSKGGYRKTILPAILIGNLKQHIERVKERFEKKGDNVLVKVPFALSRKYKYSETSWQWYWLFPANSVYQDKDDLKIYQHYIHDSTLQKYMKRLLRETRISKRASIHSLRHSFATHMLMAGTDIHQIKELLGHKHIETTMVYLHAANNNGYRLKSPLDGMK